MLKLHCHVRHAHFSSLGLACRRFPSPRLLCAHSLVRFNYTAATELVNEPKCVDNLVNSNENEVENGRKTPEWRKFTLKELGITQSMISRPARVVLNGLKRKGFDAYLVGGCVRDLILKRTPKDFDILTSAELKEVMGIFSWCEIVGRRFPICHVHVDDTIVEVSSFSTFATKCTADSSLAIERPADCDEKDYMRWRNCLRRDFTINGLMLDPYAKLVYDYTGGVEDIKKAKVRTVTPASLSLQEDCARILRGVRIAARLGFGFTRETSTAVKSFASSVLGLDRGRLHMEINYMLAYGSAEASLRILWQFGLLEILMPIQAAYFVGHGFKRRDTSLLEDMTVDRNGWRRAINVSESLFSTLDKLLAPDRPCHSILWIAILAFHKALSDQPREPLVIAAFCLATHNGGDLPEALNIARGVYRPHDNSYHELLEPQNLDEDALIREIIHLSLSVNKALSNMTDDYYISQAMIKYSKAPYSDLVYISLGLYLRVVKIFACVGQGKENDFRPKQGAKIDYHSLSIGALHEVRHVFARVIFDTVYPTNITKNQCDNK